MSASSPTFTQYQPAHRAGVVDVFRSCVGEFLLAAEEPDLHRFLDSVEASPPETAIQWVLCDENEQVMATCGLHFAPPLANLTWGLLHCDRHGQGWGERMLRHRLDYVQAHRLDITHLYSDTGPRTEGFFARYGFVTCYRQPDFWAGQMELVVMERVLQGEATRWPEWVAALLAKREAGKP